MADGFGERGARTVAVRSLGRGDFSVVDWADPEIEWVVADGLTPGSWSGVAGMAAGWRDLGGAWADTRCIADEYRELDGERVLVLAHYSGRGKTSGLELGQIRTTVAALFQLRGAQVTRLVLYWDPELALAELGLAPEAGSE